MAFFSPFFFSSLFFFLTTTWDLILHLWHGVSLGFFFLRFMGGGYLFVSPGRHSFFIVFLGGIPSPVCPLGLFTVCCPVALPLFNTHTAASEKGRGWENEASDLGGWMATKQKGLLMMDDDDGCGLKWVVNNSQNISRLGVEQVNTFMGILLSV